MNVLYYVLSCIYMPYNAVLLGCMIIKIRLKENPLQELMFFKPLKIESMCAHFFKIKPEVAGMTMMAH